MRWILSWCLLVALPLAAEATGPLRPGEALVVMQHDPIDWQIAPTSFLMRVSETPPLQAESVATLGNTRVSDLAIADPNTAYMIEVVSASTSFFDPYSTRLWKIELREPSMELLSETIHDNEPLRPLALEVGPGADLYVLWGDPPYYGDLQLIRTDSTTGVTDTVATGWGSLGATGDGRFLVGSQANGSGYDLTLFDPSDQTVDTVYIEGVLHEELDLPAGVTRTQEPVCCSPTEFVIQVFGLTDPEDQQYWYDSYPDGFPAWGLVAYDLVTGARIEEWSNQLLWYFTFGWETSARTRDHFYIALVQTFARVDLSVAPPTAEVVTLPFAGPTEANDRFIASNLVVRVPQCDNGIDDDRDGYVDSSDPDCVDSDDDWEATACSDGIDNDQDGLTDLLDPDCAMDPHSDAEFPSCNNGLDDDLDGLIDRFDYDCASGLDDSELPTCSDGIDNDMNGLTDFPLDPGCFTPYDECEGTSCTVHYPACMDFWDDDGDGWFDIEDPDCRGNFFNPSELTACSDGLDNDADGLIDLADADCSDLTGEGERPQCADGLDNDGDGDVDFPQDLECASLSDFSEQPQCSDGVDNDGDGLVDAAEDPECLSDPSRDDELGVAGGCGSSLGGTLLGVLLMPLLRNRPRRWRSAARG
jgi:hypothetical protein